MLKDYQEIERIVEEFESTWSDFIGDIEFSEAFAHLAQDPEVPFVLPEMAHWLRTTLTTYSNARVEEIIKIAEGMPVSYSDSGIGVFIDKEDLIEAIKK
jgi:hypothetical protein